LAFSLAAASTTIPGNMADEPESIGAGLGTLLADYIPLLPSGARRAGAAQVMAARVGRDPSFLVSDPIKTQLAALGIGAIGNAYTEGKGVPIRAAATILPILLTQALRRREIKSIQEDYDTQDRKRLRELDTTDMFGGWGGSSRLGAVGAYETMRKRKYQDIGSLSEAGDALTMATSGLALPVTSWLDHRSADRMQKEADFADQKNSPTIPLYLAAALASAGGLEVARTMARREFENTPALDKKEWAPLVRHVSGKAPPVFNGGDMNGNAFYTKPTDNRQSSGLANYVQQLERVEPAAKEELLPMRNKLNERRMLINRLNGHGAIVADENSSSGILAHEAGHAKIEHTPGVLQFLQRHVYPHSDLIAPLAGVGSMAAGLASGSTLSGALLGTGIGLVSGLGTIAPEAAASYYGLKGLEDYKGGALSSGQTSPLAAALSTYLTAAVLPSTLSGAVGGWISGKRKKNTQDEREVLDEDAEKQHL
jgi:hypothetical protein